MKIKIAHLPPELKKGFWELKRQTGNSIENLQLVALHIGLMNLKKQYNDDKKND